MRYIYPFNGRTKEYTKKMGWKVFAKQKEKVLSTSSKGILIINIKITK